jgi:hypothetical protein
VTEAVEQLGRELLACVRHLPPGGEVALQAAVARALDDFGRIYNREWSLSPKDRIDFLVGDIGIEVKVGGSRTDLLRQVDRYLAFPAVNALLVVTTLRRHTLPGILRGKPVLVLCLGDLLL